jgi:hypothetical protein
MRKIHSLAALETYLSDHEREFKLYRDKGKLFSALKRIAGPLLGIRLTIRGQVFFPIFYYIDQ